MIPADEVETRVLAGQPFTPPADGWYMTDGRYRRYRRAVADAILSIESTNSPALPR